jgi:hypothetical protein
MSPGCYLRAPERPHDDLEDKVQSERIVDFGRVAGIGATVVARACLGEGGIHPRRGYQAFDFDHLNPVGHASF